ncbi:MAG: 4Fe-4S binding protein [Desulfobacteraceae bacterium]|nr:4Fe-4S binding protein [Desulfobacteraceae bacterium]
MPSWNEALYRKLADHLDSLPGGFPPTKSGVELRILRRLFSPEQAELAPFLTLIPEEHRVIARRSGLSAGEASRRLEEMAAEGLVFRIARGRRPPLYMAAQYVIGIWEYHVNDLDPELIRDMNEYIPTLFEAGVWEKAPQLRTVPVRTSIQSRPEVLAYENVEELVARQKKFHVAPCICRREHRMAGGGCDRPEEACLIFGLGADYYRHRGVGRPIDLQETLDILKKAEETGLVLQPSNAQKIVNICCCCSCCCQVLKNVRRYPRPAELIASPFSVSADSGTCKGCKLCLERCPMEALSVTEKTVSVDRGRCIGCGLCVSTCPTGSLSLQRRPDHQQPKVPRNMVESTIRLGRTRGKLGAAELVKMQLKSKVDRFLVSR